MSTLTNTFNGSVAGADFATRMETLQQLSTVTGIRLPNTIVPEGESLIPYGEQRARELKEEIAALPDVATAAATLRAIRTEQRPIDTQVQIYDLRMRADNGGIHGRNCDPNKTPLAYTATAFNQAAQFVKPASVSGGFAPTLLALPPAIRADAFNHFAENAYNADKRDAVLRTVLTPQASPNGVILRRSLNAVVSNRYTGVEDHDLLTGLDAVLPAGAKVRFTQTESRSDVEVIWPTMARELKVGDIALVALHVANSQTKQSSIRIVPKILRVLCLNFTTAWGEGMDQEISIMHVGEAAAKFRSAIRTALDAVVPFVLAFGDAYNTPFPQESPTRGEILSRLVKRLELPAGFGTATLEAWDADGSRSAGDTLAGLANAMTRAATKLPIERASVIEAAAGKAIRQGWDAIL